MIAVNDAMGFEVVACHLSRYLARPTRSEAGSTRRDVRAPLIAAAPP